MKKLLCVLMSVALLLSAAACGKQQETTAEPTVETTTAPAPKTDKNAKAEDVVKDALNAFLEDDVKFAFTLDAALDLSATYKKASESSSQDMTGQVIAMLFGDEDELNVRVQPKAEGSVDSQKGMAADVEVKNNVGKLIERVMEMIGGGSAPDSSELSWLTDNVKTKVYVDKAEGKLYFLNPMTDAWNYTEADVEGEKEKIEELDLKKIFGDDYDWKITDTQYILSVDMDLKEAVLKQIEDEDEKKAAEEELAPFDGVKLKASMVFNDEKKLESSSLSLDAVTLDLSSLIPGLGLKLNEFMFKLELDHKAKVNFEVPADVKKDAEPIEAGDEPFFPDEPDEPSAPWAKDEYKVKDLVLADDDNLKLTVNGIEMDEYGDINVKFTMENKTDKSLNIDLDSAYMNGMMANLFVYETADPKATIEFDMDINDYDMEEIGQEHIYQLDLFLKVEDKDDWDADPLLEEHYTLDVQDGEAEPFETDPELALIDEKDLKAYWVKEYRESEYTGVTFFFYAENDKDVPVRFEIKTLKVNGAEFETYWEDEIQPGFAAKSMRSIGLDDLKENDIEKIEEVEGEIRAYSLNEDWDEIEYAVTSFKISYAADGSVTAETTAKTIEETAEETTEAEEPSSEQTASEPAGDVAYVNFDKMHFWINGVEFVLGESTLQDMIDSGVVPFRAGDLEDAKNNLKKNTQSGGFRIDLDEYWSAQVYVLNDTDEGKPMNECYICEIYLPNKADQTQDILKFDFPLNMTMDELKANAGEPEGDNYRHYDGDNGYYSDTFKYTMPSSKYIGSSYFSFEFIKGELSYVYLNYLP